MITVNYLDTNILLDHAKEILENIEEDNIIVLPFTILQELDKIKTFGKTKELKFKARRAVRAIRGKLRTPSLKIIYNARIDNMRMSPDDKILAYVKQYNTLGIENCDVVKFITNDFNLEIKAYAVFGTLDDADKSYQVEGYCIHQEHYRGWKKVETDDEMMKVLTDTHVEDLDYDAGTYAIIDEKLTADCIMYFNGKNFKQVSLIKFTSVEFGTVTPKDAYQLAAMHSLEKDAFTALVGPAGTGKTLLSLSYAFKALAKRRYDKLIIAVNPIPARGVAELGFYKGTKMDKLMQGSIGAILKSKLGSMEAVLNLVQSGRLEVTSIADCRGREIKRGEILYIPEAQNLTVDTTKLMIQRVEKGAKLILDGDYEAQVDSNIYSGDNNGLSRAIEVFRDYDFFGAVYLPIIYRSKLATIAELM